MDTDSSLPPLLFLAASLLIFAWASIAVAARRNIPALSLLLLSQPRSPAVALLILGAGGAMGVCILAVAVQLAAGLPIVVPIVAAIVVTAAGSSGLYLASAFWAERFPKAAKRLSAPRTWFSGSSPSPADGNGALSGGVAGEPYADGNAGNPEPPSLTPADIMNLDRHDIDMVRSISRMDDRDVQDIMVPRLDVDAVALASSLAELVGVLVATRHSRLPVYRNTMDDVVGIIHISDVLLAVASDQDDVTLESIMRQPEFVAENMAVDDLLQLMRAKSLQMVIVVDEYGGVEGIVTLEDVLEEIVGEIEDEFEDDDDELTAVGDGSWLANATMPVADVTTALGIELDYGDVNTIGGYVYTQLGRMAAVGDVVDAGAVSIEVTQVRGRRIHQLRLRPAGVGVARP